MRGKNALKNIVSSLLLQAITMICGFITTYLITKTYGSGINGLLASITQFLAYITLLESGFGSVLKSVLYKPIADNNKNEINSILSSSNKFFRKIAYIFLVYIVIICIILPLVLSSEFDILFTISLILILSISTFTEYYFGITYTLFLHANQKGYVISIIKILTLIINTVAVVIMINLKCSIHIVKLVSVFIFLLRPIIQYLYIKRKYEIKTNSNSNYNIKQKWDGLAQHIAYVVYNNTDVVLLTLFCDIKVVSIYALYASITNSVGNLVKSLSNGMDSSFGDMIAKKEQDTLNKSFTAYEGFYYTVSTIVFATLLFSILPFVNIYVDKITDINYIVPTFACLIVIDRFISTIRQPYNSLIIASGHFKETRIDNYIESGLNIIISLILVFKLGMIGVMIGTLFAITFRTIDFMYHTSKYVLKRSFLEVIKRIIITSVEFVLIFLVSKIFIINSNNYFNWFIDSFILIIISSIIVLTINTIFYRKNISNIKLIFKNIIKRS